VISSLLVEGCPYQVGATHYYIAALKRHAPWLLDDWEAVISGFGCFMGGFLYALSIWDVLERLYGSKTMAVVLERLLAINLIYLIVDFGIDADPDHSAAFIGELKICAYSILKGGPPIAGNPHVVVSGTLLWQLMRETPAAGPFVQKAMAAEFASLEQRTCSDPVRILELSVAKSATAIQMTGVFLMGHDHCHHHLDGGDGWFHELGTVIQLFDDLCDYHLDAAADIMTPPRCDVITNGTIDRTLHMLATALLKLPANFWPFRVAMAPLIATIMCDHPHVSTTYRDLALPYCPFISTGPDHDNTPIFRQALRNHLRAHL